MVESQLPELIFLIKWTPPNFTWTKNLKQNEVLFLSLIWLQVKTSRNLFGNMGERADRKLKIVKYFKRKELLLFKEYNKLIMLQKIILVLAQDGEWRRRGPRRKKASESHCAVQKRETTGWSRMMEVENEMCGKLQKLLGEKMEGNWWWTGRGLWGGGQTRS